MRIKIEQAPALFSQAIQAVSKDPISWEKWQCVHVTINSETTRRQTLAPHTYIISYIGCTLETLEGITFVCSDQHVLMLCRDVSPQQLRVNVHDMLEKARLEQGIAASYALYDLSTQWPSLARLCSDQCFDKTAEPGNEQAQPGACFSEINDLEYILKHHIGQRRHRERIQIMVVEDDPVTCRIVSNLLRDDYDLVLAETAEEAVLHYILHAPDMVFLDIGLPDKSGMDVARSILRHDADAYVVMFTGNRDAERISEAMGMGAKGYIEKPFRRERLFHYINDCNVKQRHMRLLAPVLH